MLNLGPCFAKNFAIVDVITQTLFATNFVVLPRSPTTSPKPYCAKLPCANLLTSYCTLDWWVATSHWVIIMVFKLPYCC